jgi:exodeoxyribonuclease VIII
VATGTQLRRKQVIYESLPASEYHALPAISNSALNKLAQSPYHYWAHYIAEGRPVIEPTAAMRAGTLAHCAILEPRELPMRYVVRPAEIDGRTKEGKAWLAEALLSRREVVTAAEMATAEAQRAAVLEVPELASLLGAGQAEQSILWDDTATDVECKARPDWVHTLADGRVILLDVKTTPDVSPDAFAKSVANFGYHRQAAFYTDGYQRATGVEVAAFIFAAVTNAYPYVAAAFLLHEDALARGQRECAALLRKYAECKASNTWPRPAEGVTVLNLPAWSKEITE